MIDIDRFKAFNMAIRPETDACASSVNACIDR
jgi:hypothetical protein